MHIKQITSQNRRDFRAIYECEHCGATREGTGYDDDYFHERVIPLMKCSECEQKASEEYRPMTPKYPSGTQL